MLVSLRKTKTKKNKIQNNTKRTLSFADVVLFQMMPVKTSTRSKAAVAAAVITTRTDTTSSRRCSSSRADLAAALVAAAAVVVIGAIGE